MNMASICVLCILITSSKQYRMDVGELFIKKRMKGASFVEETAFKLEQERLEFIRRYMSVVIVLRERARNGFSRK